MITVYEKHIEELEYRLILKRAIKTFGKPLDLEEEE